MTSFSLRLPLAAAALAGSLALYASHSPTAARLAPDPNNADLKLPAGFGAFKVAETGGQARHLTVLPNGLIYVKLNKAKDGKGILVLKPGANGRATVAGSFGTTAARAWLPRAATSTPAATWRCTATSWMPRAW